jgi:hypothetical protein
MYPYAIMKNVKLLIIIFCVCFSVEGHFAVCCCAECLSAKQAALSKLELN